MNTIEARIHRTWVQLLLDYGYKEAAAIAIDTDIELIDRGWEEQVTEERGRYRAETILIKINVPSGVYVYVKKNDSLKKLLQQALHAVLDNRVIEFEDYSFNRNEVAHRTAEELLFEYRLKLIDVEDNWKATIREMIASSSGIHNQGSTTKLMFAKEHKEPLSYNNLNFASQSEIRIAQELEQRKVLFFPLVVGVRAETSQQYQDHREADFLICDKGVWGILEVAYHPDRYEKDKEKDGWWKKSGILCIEHHTAERCFNNPKQVVDEFLKILAQHKR